MRHENYNELTLIRLGSTSPPMRGGSGLLQPLLKGRPTQGQPHGAVTASVPW